MLAPLNGLGDDLAHVAGIRGEDSRTCQPVYCWLAGRSVSCPVFHRLHYVEYPQSPQPSRCMARTGPWLIGLLFLFANRPTLYFVAF